MLIALLVGFALALPFSSCEKNITNPDEAQTFEQKLFGLKDMEVVEIAPQNGFPRQFEIYVTQPLDHNNPSGNQFRQQVFLSHRSESAPVVFMPSGYAANARTAAEISQILGSNQIYVAHRFMTNARPNPMEWNRLTVRQAAADFHRIVAAFKSIYRGKWLSYGASKNGCTALFHRRFYPDDVDATLASVAPISFAIEDPRYDAFLSTMGDEAIRNKLKRCQIDVLKNRNGILPLLRAYMNKSSLTFSMPEGAILEFETLEYPFSFWQYGSGDITAIPDTGLSAQQLFDFIEGQGYLRYYSDEYIDYLEPFYYQMYTELGYYRLIDDHLSHLLVDVRKPSYSYFAPRGVPLSFSPSTMQDVNQWLQNEGNNIVYVYGERDPWTAGAVEITGKTNALKIIQPGGNHSLLLSNLNQKSLVYSTLERWLGVPVREGGAIVDLDDSREELVPFRRHR